MRIPFERIRPYLLLGAVVLVGGVWGGCHLYEAWFRTDEERIRASLLALEEGGRARNARTILAEVDEAYQDAFSPDKERLAQFVRYWVITNQPHEVELSLEDIRVAFSETDPDFATVSLRVSGNAPVTQVTRHLRSSGEVSLLYVRRGRRWSILTAARSGEAFVISPDAGR